MEYHRKVEAQNKKKKTMIWTLTTMLKFPCSAFFSNYVQHINDFRDTLFHGLNVKESKKNISCTSFMEYHLKIEAQNKKNYDLDPCNHN